MTRSFVMAVLAGTVFGIAAPAPAEEPKATGTVNINSSVLDADKLQAFSGTGVILEQKEWEKLAAAWGIKDVEKVDFTKELLLVGTWRGTSFKMLGDVKAGDLTVELVGDKDVQPGFRYRVMSLSRAGITKFNGKVLPAAAPSEVKPIGEEGPPAVALGGDLSDRELMKLVPASGVITTQKEWDTLVEKWRIKGVRKVDFSKEVLVVGASQAGAVDLAHTVKNGDLTVTTTGTQAARDGFRWKLVSVRRDGFKTVNGKILP